jgi:hypothetical protein
MGCFWTFSETWRPGWLTWPTIRDPCFLDWVASSLKFSKRSPEYSEPRGIIGFPGASTDVELVAILTIEKPMCEDMIKAHIAAA